MSARTYKKSNWVKSTNPKMRPMSARLHFEKPKKITRPMSARLYD